MNLCILQARRLDMAKIIDIAWRRLWRSKDGKRFTQDSRFNPFISRSWREQISPSILDVLVPWNIHYLCTLNRDEDQEEKGKNPWRIFCSLRVFELIDGCSPKQPEKKRKILGEGFLKRLCHSMHIQTHTALIDWFDLDWFKANKAEEVSVESSRVPSPKLGSPLWKKVAKTRRIPFGKFNLNLPFLPPFPFTRRILAWVTETGSRPLFEWLDMGSLPARSNISFPQHISAAAAPLELEERSLKPIKSLGVNFNKTPEKKRFRTQRTERIPGDSWSVTPACQIMNLSAHSNWALPASNWTDITRRILDLCYS